MGIFSAPRVATGVESPEEYSTLRHSDTHGWNIWMMITYSIGREDGRRLGRGLVVAISVRWRRRH